jgi:2-methylcitrate dehydratase
MLNGVISRSYDFEVMTAVVGQKQVPSHHSPTTCMTALALCERAKLSGKDFLTALVIGDDIAARMLAASGLDFGQGWDGAPIYSSVAAAAIASRLLGLSAEQTQDAFGLVVQTIAGTVQNIWDGSTDWKLPQGLAARNGIFAAQLAKRGWVGMGDALHAPYGFYAQYTAGCVEPDLLTSNLGKAFYAEEYFKPYPACAATHSTIECAIALRANNKFSAGEVKSVVVRLPPPSLKGFVNKPFEARRHPQCDANFSTQFMVANVLLRGSVKQEHYADELIRSPEMTALIASTSVAALPAGRDGVEIELTTRAGRKLVQTHSGVVSRNPGVRPSSEEEIVQKFRQQVAFSGFVPTSTAEEIIRRVGALDQEADMSQFAGVLTRSYLAKV